MGAKNQAAIRDFFGLFAALFGVLIFSLSGEVGALIFLSVGRYLPNCAEPIQTECELCDKGKPARSWNTSNTELKLIEKLLAEQAYDNLLETKKLAIGRGGDF